MTPEHALKLLSEWKQDKLTVAGFLQTTAVQMTGYEIPAYTGLILQFKGHIDQLSDQSLAIKILGPDSGNIMLYLKDAEYVYNDQQQDNPLLTIMFEDKDTPSRTFNYEQIIGITGGYIYRDDQKVAPTWVLSILKPPSISQSDVSESELVM